MYSTKFYHATWCWTKISTYQMSVLKLALWNHINIAEENWESVLTFYAQHKSISICYVHKQTHSGSKQTNKQKSMWNFRIIRENKFKEQQKWSHNNYYLEFYYPVQFLSSLSPLLLFPLCSTIENDTEKGQKGVQKHGAVTLHTLMKQVKSP